MLSPLAAQRCDDLAFGVGVDDVDADPFGLLEPVDAVDGLDEVGELEVDADEDRPMTVALEVAARSRQDRLGGQQPLLPVRERDDAPLSFVEIERSVHLAHTGDRRGKRPAFGFGVMPQNEMVVGGISDELGGEIDALGERVPFLG